MIDKIDKSDSFTTIGVNGLDLPGTVEAISKDLKLIEAQTNHYIIEDEQELSKSGFCLICNKAYGAPYHNKCLQSFFEVKKVPVVPIKSIDFSSRLCGATRRASMSGMQAKIGVNIHDGFLQSDAEKSRYILKPPIIEMPSSVFNEFISMKITESIIGSGEVADCALVMLADGQFSYITKRFDREGVFRKIHMEDLSQILGQWDQFGSSYEEVTKAIEQASNKIIAGKFLLALLSQFYLGNNDMHLKNIALVDIDSKGRYKNLAPLYDCLNTESILRKLGKIDEMALSFFEDDYETPVYLRDGHSSYQTFKELYKRCGFQDSLLLCQVMRK